MGWNSSFSAGAAEECLWACPGCASHPALHWVRRGSKASQSPANPTGRGDRVRLFPGNAGLKPSPSLHAAVRVWEQWLWSPPWGKIRRSSRLRRADAAQVPWGIVCIYVSLAVLWALYHCLLLNPQTTSLCRSGCSCALPPGNPVLRGKSSSAEAAQGRDFCPLPFSRAWSDPR